MKIGMRRFYLFILLFTVSSLLFHSPSDFEAFADSNSSGSVESIEQINDSTTNGPVLENNDQFGHSGVEGMGGGPNFNDININDIFGDIFGDVFGTRSQSRRQRLHTRINVGFESSKK